MRGIGGERTISLLISAPKVSVRSLLYILSAMVKKQREEWVYRIYVTDTIRAMSETIAKHFGGAYTQRRYAEIISPKQPEQTAEQIIEGLKAQGLQILDGEEE